MTNKSKLGNLSGKTEAELRRLAKLIQKRLAFLRRQPTHEEPRQRRRRRTA